MQKETKKAEVETSCLTPVKIEGFADGQFVVLEDIKSTEKILKKAVKSAKGVVVTRENYKKEAADAERKLREFRYELNKVKKSNNSIINAAKKSDAKVYDDLVGIISGEEDRLKGEIEVIKDLIKKEKEEERLREERRVAKIKQDIKDEGSALEKMIYTAKKDSDLVTYNKALDSLEERFESFGEFEFEAKKTYAIYAGRKSEVEAAIAKEKQAEADKKLAEELKKKAEKEAKEKAEKKMKVLEYRVSKLKKMGFERNDNNGNMTLGVVSVNVDSIAELDEVDWSEKLEEIPELIKSEEKKRDEEAKKLAVKTREIWDGLVKDLVELGGDKKNFKLKKGAVPSPEKIQELKQVSVDLRKKRQEQREKALVDELKPYVGKVLASCTDLQEMYDKETEGKLSGAGAEVVKAVLDGFENVVNNVFGEIINTEK